MAVEYDEIGIWSEVRLAIIKKYASAYTSIMEAHRRTKIPSLRWLYIDAYAGPGYYLSKTSGELVEGSPLIALKHDAAIPRISLHRHRGKAREAVADARR